MKFTKWYNEQINKYTFIKESTVDNAYFRIKYVNKEGKEILKKLSIRSSVKLLQDVLTRIRNEVGIKNDEERGKIDEITISICAF